MITALRRLFWLALLGGASFAAWSVWRSRSEAALPAGAPEWPPIEPPPTLAAAALAWVAPEAGNCPPSHPVKANENSGIYHVPGGRFYDRTGPERCYADPEAAEADGFRRSKS